MIRNVVVGRLRDEHDRPALSRALAAIAALEPDGLVEVHVGLDEGLRPGGWSFAITSDFVDEDAYRRYDAGAEHNRIRRELFDPICSDLARVQFRC